eukprot:1668964-Prymnesium_polylepis.1
MPSSAAVAAVSKASSAVSSQDALEAVALEAAVAEGDAAAVLRIIEHGDVAIALEQDLLFICCEKGHADTAAVLLAARASPDMQSNSATPLHVACTHGHAGVVRVLLGAHADVAARGRYGTTPLLCASEHAASHQCAQLLLAAGAA